MRLKMIALSLSLMMVFASCGKVGKSDSNSLFTSPEPGMTSGTGNDKNPKKKIGLIMKTLTNPFFINMEKGARKAEQEFGIDLIVKTGAQETSIDQQIQIVEEMIQSKVNAIVIAPGSSTDLIPVLKKAQDAGIAIVNIDNRLNKDLSAKLGLKDVPFISVNNENAAYLSAKYISDKIKKPTKVAIIEGIRGADNAEQRRLGALRAFKENKNTEIVASETANWKIDEAETLTKKLLSIHNDLGAIFCANDMMAIGAINAIEKAKKDRILVAAYDALDEAKRELKAGKLQVTIDQKPDIQGYTGVTYALKMLKGEKAPPETMLDVEVIDAGKLK